MVPRFLGLTIASGKGRKGVSVDEDWSGYAIDGFVFVKMSYNKLETVFFDERS